MPIHRFTDFARITHQFDQGDFRGRENPHRWTPGSGPSAGIEYGPFFELIVTILHGIESPCNEVEGKDLASMRVPGELQVEKSPALFRHFRPVFK